MFGQKKKKAQFNMMGDSRVTCYDFIRRFDELFESYRAADYKLYHRLSEEEMRPKLDHQCRRKAHDVRSVPRSRRNNRFRPAYGH